MADSNARELLRISDHLFGKKAHIDERNQALAEAFYPLRADFTRSPPSTDEVVEFMIESVPAQMHREFALAMGSFLRPRGKKWFMLRAKEKERNTDAAKEVLSAWTEAQRAELYAKGSQFRRAMLVGDMDFAAFGNAVHSLLERQDRMGWVWRTWHLRDCAWDEDDKGEVVVLHRKIPKMTLAMFVARYGENKLTERQKRVWKRNPHEEISLVHVAMPADLYDAYDKKRVKGKRFVSVEIDPSEGGRILREGGYHEFPYIVRRHTLMFDSVYGHSPAAAYGLCDARLLQSQAQVVLESGEKALDPPLIMRDEVFGQGVNLFAGGITWADVEGDRPIRDHFEVLHAEGQQSIGLELKRDTRETLAAAWSLNKLTMPPSKEMTAYEASQVVAEHLRSLAPILEPFEADNQVMLSVHFERLMRVTLEKNAVGEAGPLGFIADVPEELRDADVEFEFDTPVQMAYQRQRALIADQVLEGAKLSMSVDPETRRNYDFDRIARARAEAVGAEPEWLVPEEVIAEQRAAEQERAAQEQALAEAAAVSDVAKRAGEAVVQGADAVDAVVPDLGVSADAA